MREFKCPKCGGPRFRTDVEFYLDGKKLEWRRGTDLPAGTEMRIPAYHCGNATDGGAQNHWGTFGPSRPDVRDCGWKGTAEECGMAGGCVPGGATGRG